jgi:hypothetical protein
MAPSLKLQNACTRTLNFPKNGGRYLVDEILTRLKGRIKDMRHVVHFADEPINVGAIQPIAGAITCGRVEIRLLPRQADDFPIARCDQTIWSFLTPPLFRCCRKSTRKIAHFFKTNLNYVADDVAF